MVVGALCVFPPAASAREVTLPINLDSAYLREVFASQVFTGPGTSARVWDDGTDCKYMVISDPGVSTANGLIDLTMAGRALVGHRLGDRCIVALDWSGTVETSQEVQLEPAGTALRFRVVDSRVSDDTGQGIRVGILWDWIKDYVHPRLAAVRVDLQPALDELKAVLRLVLPGRDEALDQALASISLKSADVVDNGLRVSLSMQLPDSYPGTVEAESPEPALTPAELAHFESMWQGWDSFVTFVVKHFAGTADNREIRRELLEVLIEARYDLLDILTEQPRVMEPDPVRELFVKTWARLTPVLRQLRPELTGDRALHLLSFVTAGDALQTLDSLGPEFNLDISIDGLRRLARILAPETEEDPLIFRQQVDPDLRELFDFGPPLPLRPEAAPPSQGWLFVPWRDAQASVPVDDSLVKKLNSWVPPPDEIEPYLESVHRLLDATGKSLASEADLDPRLQEMFRVLVLATAWQETCWRQFQLVNGKMVPIRSPAGAVGMMQVVPNVWRGFYDPRGLTSDIGYNAAAGGEILMYYLVNYAIPRGEDKAPGGRDNLAWATYAAYNGGPGQLRRYRESGTSSNLRAIDATFRDKFRKIEEGNELAVKSCYSG